MAENSSESPRNPVYDFLYCDTRRVGSLLAQFNPAGYLTGQRKTVSSGNATERDGSIGIDLKIIKGNFGGGTSSEQGRESEEIYDPFWTGAITLLDHLEKRNLLKRDMHEATVGQLVLVSGHLLLLDLRVLEAVWQNAKLTNYFVGNTAGRTPQEIEDSSLTFEFVKSMPHTVQARIHCPKEGDKAASLSWMTLQPSELVIPPNDILMKYGADVPGIWSMLAIKDATPDKISPIDPDLQKELATTNWGVAAEKRHTTTLALLAQTLAPRARAAMGRPAGFYGVTPIMIFRELMS